MNSDLVYIIPPYLLNTSLGARLQKRLSLLDVKLAERNCVSTTSKYYNSDKTPDKAVDSNLKFSNDPILNQIIKDKLIYKLSTIGVAGDTYPMEKLQGDEEYLFEIYEIFKKRLLLARSKKSEEFVNDPKWDTVDTIDTESGIALQDPDTAPFDPSDPIGTAQPVTAAAAADAEAEADPFEASGSEGDVYSFDEDDDEILNYFYDGVDYDDGDDLIDQDTIDQADDDVGDDVNTVGGHSGGKHKNLFNSEKIGEFKIENVKAYITRVLRENADSLPLDFKTCRYSTRQYRKLMSSPLKTVLLRGEAEKQQISKINPSFIEINDVFFKYPLPLTWTPLIGTSYKKYLEGELGLDIKIDNGFSNINLSKREEPTQSSKLKEQYKDKYTNFITDKAVPPSSGVFYFEVEIQQKCTSATNFKSLIITNEDAISSNNSMHVCLGFTRRFALLEPSKPKSHANYIDELTNFEGDLEYLKNNIDNYLSTLESREKSPSTIDFEYSQGTFDDSVLTHAPGTFRRSYAVNFEDSLFYNSERAYEYLQKSAIHHRRLSLNRQIDDEEHGKLDLGFNLQSYKQKSTTRTSNSDNSDVEDYDFYHTEVIGCGINFFDKSIFYTSNGILIKVITKDQLNTQLAENIFFDAENDMAMAMEEVINKGNPNNLTINDWKSVYPMIGIKLNTDLSPTPGSSSPSSSSSSTKIITNLGFKEFKYNINNHIHSFANLAHNSLYQGLLNKIEGYKSGDSPSDDTEEALLNIQNTQSNLINEFIMGYLNNRGYINTFNAFDHDVKSLATEVNPSLSPISDSEELLKKSHANERQVIMNYIRQSDFDHALTILSDNYPQLTSSSGVTFDLKLFKYIHLIKSYLESKHESTSTASTLSQSEVFSKLFVYGKDLGVEYPNQISKIQIVSSLLLIKDYASFKDLPKASEFIFHYDKKLDKLAETINKMILKHLGFNEQSNLEKIVETVDKNIELLGVKYCDENYMMVNFERDYMDL